MFHKIKKYLFAAIAGMILTAGVTAGAAAANITANTLTPVRRGAGPEYQTITAIRAGQTVEKLGTSGNWIKVNANGKTGYIYKSTAKDGGRTRVRISKKPNLIPLPQDQVFMGNFKLSFYAGDTKTASGRTPRIRHTIAADTSLLPMYTKVYIEGWGNYEVEDRGGAIKGKRIDIFVESEAVARKNGIKYADVYVLK